MTWRKNLEKDMNDLNLQIDRVEIRMNGEEKLMWTNIETDILIHVADCNLLGLRL